MKVKTVKVKADTKSGYVTINASDFNGSNYTLYVEKELNEQEEGKKKSTKKKQS